jgi:hypothetical protein
LSLFDRDDRTDCEKTNDAAVAARRWPNGIITRSHNADALRRDVVVSHHDPRGCLTRDDDARGSSERGALGLAEGIIAGT